MACLLEYGSLSAQMGEGESLLVPPFFSLACGIFHMLRVLQSYRPITERQPRQLSIKA